MTTLRGKIEPDPPNPTYIHTIRDVGYRFEHLAEIISRSRDPERLGVCFDTCHVFAAGFPLTEVGPIAALLLPLAVLTVAIFGLGSVAGTIMSPPGGAPVPGPDPGLLPQSIPVMSDIALAIFALALMFLVWRRFQRDRARSKRLE